MSDEALIVEQERHIATFTINRPEKRNALNPEIHAGMVEHIDRMSMEGEVRCLVVRGQGDLAFSAGDDLRRPPGDPGPRPTPGKSAEHQWPHRKTVQAIFDAPFPVVAMIDGYCVGGGLALASECDIRICTDRAQLGIPPSRLGIIYDYERIQVFIDLVGPAFTKELFCSGLRVNAQRALDMGLVNKVVEPEQLESEVYGLAKEFARNAPLSLRGRKRTINTLVARHRAKTRTSPIRTSQICDPHNGQLVTARTPMKGVSPSPRSGIQCSPGDEPRMESAHLETES